MEIANSYAGNISFDETGTPILTESGQSLGNRVISAFAGNHDGIVEYSVDDSLFRLRLLIGS